MRLCRTLLWLALFIPAVASAALEFRVLSWNGDIDDLRFADGRAEIVLSARERVLSPTYRHHGSGDLELYRLVSRGGQSPAHIVVATLPLPQTLSRALLVLNPTPDGRITGLWLNDSAEENPAGTLRLHNLSTHALAVRAGEETRLLSPSANTRINFADTLRALPVQVAAEVAGQWQRVVSTSQPVRPRYRLIVLLRDGRPTPEDPAGLVEWLTFYDVPPRPTAQPGESA